MNHNILLREAQSGYSDLESTDPDRERPSAAFQYATEEDNTPDVATPIEGTHPQPQQQGMSKSEVSDLIVKMGKPVQDQGSRTRNEADTSGSSLECGSGLLSGSSPVAATTDSNEDDSQSQMDTQPFLNGMQMQERGNWRKTRNLCKTGTVVGIVIIIVSAIVLLYLGVNFRITHVIPCDKVSSSYNLSMAQNSSAILINTTDMASTLNCFEPLVEVSTSFPVNLYQLSCNNLSYLPQNVPRNRSYPRAKNPLPVVFDEGYLNYLANANITVTVNVSSEASSNEFIFICVYNEPYQFQTVYRRSSADFWRNYKGTQCSRHSIDNVHEIKESFYTSSRPEYVFIMIGTTVDLLHTFQFTLRVNGWTISEPESQSQIRECIGLDDQHRSCKFKLNITDDSDGLCIISSRPVDLVSTDPFSNLTVKWMSKKPLKGKEIAAFSSVGAMILIGFVMTLVTVIICLWLKPTNSTPLAQAQDN